MDGNQGWIGLIVVVVDVVVVERYMGYGENAMFNLCWELDAEARFCGDGWARVSKKKEAREHGHKK